MTLIGSSRTDLAITAERENVFIFIFLEIEMVKEWRVIIIYNKL